jgi:hypothetical protein
MSEREGGRVSFEEFYTVERAFSLDEAEEAASLKAYEARPGADIRVLRATLARGSRRGPHPLGGRHHVLARPFEAACLRYAGGRMRAGWSGSERKVPMGSTTDFNGSIRVPFDKREEAVAAILAAHDDSPFWSNPRFQEKRDRGESPTLTEVLDEVFCNNGCLTEGTEVEYLADDEIELSGQGWGESPDQTAHALAPFVTEGEVYAEGEDASRWRWVFANGQIVEQYAYEVYGLSPELAEKLQNQVDRDTAAMRETQPEEAPVG